MRNDTRTAFESHFKLSSRQAKRDNAGEYIDEKVRDKWEGWQAAMPKLDDDDEALFPNDTGLAVIRAERYWQLREIEDRVSEMEIALRRFTGQ